MIGLGFLKGRVPGSATLYEDYSEERASLSLLKVCLILSVLDHLQRRLYDIPLLETRFILSRLSSKSKKCQIRSSLSFEKGLERSLRKLSPDHPRDQLLGMEREDDIRRNGSPPSILTTFRAEMAVRFTGFFTITRRMSSPWWPGWEDSSGLSRSPGSSSEEGDRTLLVGRLFWEHRCPEKAISCFENALKRCDESLSWEAMRWLSMALRRPDKVISAIALGRDADLALPKDAFLTLNWQNTTSTGSKTSGRRSFMSNRH